MFSPWGRKVSDTTERLSLSTFSFSISISSEYSGLIALKVDWFDLLPVQENFMSLLQHHSLKALIT